MKYAVQYKRLNTTYIFELFLYTIKITDRILWLSKEKKSHLYASLFDLIIDLKHHLICLWFIKSLSNKWKCIHYMCVCVVVVVSQIINLMYAIVLMLLWTLLLLTIFVLISYLSVCSRIHYIIVLKSWMCISLWCANRYLNQIEKL